MFARLLLIAALAGIAGYSGGLAQDSPKKPSDEPKKPKKEEPKKPKDEPKKKSEAKGPVTAPGDKGKAAPKRDTLKKYDDVITKDAKTQPGVFAVHKIDDKVYFEIPADKFGKLMMFRAEVARGPAGGSGVFNGRELGTKFVRFERRENKIQVIEAAFDKRSSADTRAAVEASATEPIIATFNVEAEGKDRSAVIAVSGLFMQDSLDVGAKRAGGSVGMIDSERSYLQEVKAFPTNIEARAMLTLRGGGRPSFGPDGPTMPSFGGGSHTSTVLVHYSLFALPDEPMMARFFDPRVGYFTEGYYDYSSPKTWVTEKELIARFRLVKKDKTADVSEPEKPITFYLSPEIPEKYREAMKKGVEDWQPAFEKAGFKNAIVCKDPPGRTEDPNWDPEDARYSVIRWVAEPVANAMGPHVHDPRSGEIISAHVIFWHDILKITQLWYFVQCSAVDERAKKLPLPDELTCDLIRYVTAHEVGHTLGLRHNHRASQAYSIKDLRDPEFAAKHGPVASIMSYGRFNYVAQPEDKVDPKDLIPKVAPYDLFAIEWGYKPIPGASTPEAEKPTLDEWAGKQVKEPFLRFGGEDGPSMVDPTVLTENIGSDPVKATELGLKNMGRVLGHLVEATTVPGEDFEVLQEAYSALMMHRRNWFSAVAKQVGGVKESRTLAGPGRGQQFSRVPVEKQKEAVKFLVENCFTTPKKMLDPEVVNQFKFSGVASDVMNLQRSVLSRLLSAGVLNRLLDAEVVDPDNAFPVSELVAEVQAGVWSELKADAPKTDPLRRNLQRAYIEILKKEFESPPEGGLNIGRLPRGLQLFEFGPSRSAELRAVARISLRDLARQIEAALPKTKDAATKAHLQDSLAEITNVLENNGTKKKASE